MTLDELRSLAASVGFPDPETAAAVAMAESRGNPSAQNIVTNPAPGNGPERSFGLWQINTLAHPQYPEHLLLDPTYNAQAALAISQGGTNWTPWSTYNHGDYRQYMTDSNGRSIEFTPKVTAAVALGIVGTAAAVAYLLTPEIFGLPGFADAHENPTEADEEHPSMRVQSLIFPRDKWTKAEARAWLKAHGYKSRSVDETSQSWRFRQEDPDQFDVLRTKSFGDNIKAVVGR
jgi:hypothetical protein